jgi:hypothetical protein
MQSWDLHLQLISMGRTTEVRLHKKAVCIDRWTLHRGSFLLLLFATAAARLNTHPCRTEAWVCGAQDRMKLVRFYLNVL